MSSPDPGCPVCPCCDGKQRRTIRELTRQVSGADVTQGVFWDVEGRKHQHFGSPSGYVNYQCECGHAWRGAFAATYFPCWCGWLGL